MATKLLTTILVSLLVSCALGERYQGRLTEAQQCRLQRLAATQPSQRIRHEGGVTEMWDDNDDQFQCAGVSAVRNILEPNSLSLPNFQPMPRMVYIEKGQGLISVVYPGCAETYHSQQTGPRGQQQEGQQTGQRSDRDLHQKVNRILQGDIIALPAGAAHWCFNDGDEELVAISVSDINHQNNQLDQQPRQFYLAGSLPRQSQSQIGSQKESQLREKFQNMFNAFDSQMLAEALNVPREVVRRMQNVDDRGLIVKVRRGMAMIRPDEEEEPFRLPNGLEEGFCTMKIRQNLDNIKEADVYSRQAGRLVQVNMQKLPILRSMDMSAEKGELYPNAVYTPHWNAHGHTVVYVTQGEARVQVVSHNGQNVMDSRVTRGEMFVIPQFFASMLKAGNNGCQFVAMKTTSLPMKSPLAGYTSVFRAMPDQVIAESYQVSPSQAQDLKYNRLHQTLFMPPTQRSS
ncbi:Cupin 1 [Dillenia turbinata]|uniref:Cupin 1 n=1 Tax=Dillenia turbinata TaxID=194707 RepID=A0AAN8ZND8_9MAGN